MALDTSHFIMFPLATVRTRLSPHNPKGWFSNRNLLVVVGQSFLGGLERSMIGVVWQPFVLSLGLSMSALGFLVSLGGFAGLIPTLVSPVGGWLADRRGRKLLLLIGSVAAIAAYSLYSLAGFAQIGILIVPGIILLGISVISQPANAALVGESVRAGRRGSAFSLVTFAAVLPGILAPLGAGLLADRVGYATIFPIVLAAELISFILIVRYLRETRIVTEPHIDWGALGRMLRRAWMPPGNLRWFYVAVAMDMFAWGMGWGLLYGLLSKSYNFSASDLGILSAITNLTWALMQLPIGRALDRFGPKNILVLSEALGPPVLLIWMTQTRFEIFAASMPLFALTAALWIPARQTFITHSIEPARRAEAFGRLAAFTGLVAFPSTYLGGFLYDHFGFAAPILGNLLGSFTATLILLFLVREPSLLAVAEVAVSNPM